MENTIITISAMVLGLTAVAGETGLPSRFKPAFAVVLGVALAFLFLPIGKELFITGIIASLSAMGLWAGTKKTVAKQNDESLIG
jgi:membrane protein implicated in regulation of membrane protease activity